MGILNDLKRVVFGAKAVAKSAVDKTVEASQEAGEAFIEKSGDFIEKAADKASQAYDTAKEKLEDFTEKLWEEITSKKDMEEKDLKQETNNAGFSEDAFGNAKAESTEPKDTSDATEQPFVKKMSEIGEEVLDKGGKAAEKLMDTAEKVGGKVWEVSEKVGEKVMNKAEEIGGKIIEKGGEAFEKAKEFGANLWEKANELVEKAQQEAEKESLEEMAKKAEAMNQEAAFKSKAADKSADSTLGGFDSFFEKAKRFSEGDYYDASGKSTSTPPAQEGAKNANMEIMKDPDYLPAPKTEGKIPGFDDLDGDGNELIDDAIIDKD